MDDKETLHHYLRTRRDRLLACLDGLGEYDVRRPLTPTGTNLLGLVKHVASVQLDYFGEVFDRPSGRVLPWYADDAEPDADLWVPADETREGVVELHHFSAAQADATIEALPLDAVGRVPWWPPGRAAVTLHLVLAHVLAETAQHLGHADILRELVTGGVVGKDDPNVTNRTRSGWSEHAARIEEAARRFAE